MGRIRPGRFSPTTGRRRRRCDVRRGPAAIGVGAVVLGRPPVTANRPSVSEGARRVIRSFGAGRSSRRPERLVGRWRVLCPPQQGAAQPVMHPTNIYHPNLSYNYPYQVTVADGRHPIFAEMAAAGVDEPTI